MDIIYNIHKFLKAEELEKMRLVSKNWNLMLINHQGTLPLKAVDKQILLCDNGVVKMFEIGSEMDEENGTEIDLSKLQNFYLEYFFMDMSLISLQTLTDYVRIKGQPLICDKIHW